MFGGIDNRGKKPASPFERYLLDKKGAGETLAQRTARITREATGRRTALNPIVRQARR